MAGHDPSKQRRGRDDDPRRSGGVENRFDLALDQPTQPVPTGVQAWYPTRPSWPVERGQGTDDPLERPSGEGHEAEAAEPFPTVSQPMVVDPIGVGRQHAEMIRPRA